MSEQQIIKDYLDGRIGQWALYRKLLSVGISAGTALTLALGLPAVVRGQVTLDELKLKSKQTRCDDFTELDRLLMTVSHALTHAAETANLNPLAVSLARLAVNVDLPMERGTELTFRGDVAGVPVNLSGSIANVGEGEFRMVNIAVDGNLGERSLNLSGNVQAPPDGSEGSNVNLGQARLDFAGNAGEVPLNFSGNIGHVVPSGNIPE